MNAYLEKIIKEKKFTDAQGNVIELNWNVPVEEGLKLQELITQYQVATSLEIGTAYGISSIFICEAISRQAGAHHITIDPFQESFFKNNGLYNIRQAGYGNLLEAYNDYSYFVLPDLLRKKTVVDFIFIDGYHTFDYAFVDFFFSDLLLKPGGLLVIDDTDWPAVKKVCEYIVTNRAYKLIYPSPRNIGSPSWKHHIVISLFSKAGRAHLLEERYRKFEEYRPVLELPLSARFLAFRKLCDDHEFRKEETFHKNF
ncbi:MAG: hypothetical protein KatS3mg031_1264 [Chitinophagales bacterium]|nr:MAG: hypothetical protein KatS3mg031_1264 [Chitinophagales bacterium]